MKKFSGTVLQIIAALWIINGVAGIALSFVETGSGGAFIRGVVSALLGWGLFQFGTWLKTQKSGVIAQRVANTWWGADQGFRLSIFIGILWVIGIYIWHDSYSRDLGIVFTPPIGLVIAYFAYRKFVVIPPSAFAEENDYNVESDEEFSKAIRTSDLNTMKRLLESRTISPHGKNKHGRGWLQLATLASAVEPCKLLLEYGAFPLDKDDIGTSASVHASATGNKDLIALYSTVLQKSESANSN
ncbi:hypothetical protein GBK02_09755 [Dechloromonas sp. TW-R-39-2]|uniref:hypothetical protein n=1 Tax=Dechloromonas sp. TW-R-39-2 TaxID=2654218 RepID=UPI00193E4C65|nr:hypothetical protein [Dechloromonas sp. TW-R-39-2]QRM19665.1 hypothetical protein GBK02_09755 [Dechloromonas sp. TW-R-39-2]